MASVLVQAAAKINLALRVGPLRADGFHELATVYQAVSLHDTLRAESARSLSLAITGEGAAELPTSEDNLALRAAKLLQVRTGTRRGARLVLDKAIPVAAGLAGGSSDAAAALVGLDALWGTNLDRPELLRLAAELGSDVPFSLSGGTALGTGRGEVLTDVLATGRFAWVLALAAGGLATPSVYTEYDRLPARSGPEPNAVLSALRRGDPRALGKALHNDLQRAALRLRPRLAAVLDAGADLGALGGVVSGSGPTVALLCRDDTAATELAAALAGLDVCRAVRRVTGPVPGARVLPEGAA